MDDHFDDSGVTSDNFNNLIDFVPAHVKIKNYYKKRKTLNHKIK